MPAGPERLRQRAIVRWLRTVLPLGSIPFAIDNEQAAAFAPGMSKEQRQVRAMRYGAARKASGVLTGMTDLGVVLPNGTVCWIEVKDDGGVVSSAQQDVHDRLRAAGHRVGVATDIDTCRTLLTGWGVYLHEAEGQPTPAPRVRYAARAARLVDDPLPF